MRVYKSPVQLKPSNMQKKSSINFVKNVAAPKQVKSQNTYNNQKQYQFQNTANSNHMMTSPSMEKFRSKQGENVYLVIKRQSVEVSGLNNKNSAKNIKHSIISNSTNYTSSTKPMKVLFPFSSQTQIKHMISFIHSQIQDNMVFIKSSNIYIDYILGLKDFKVKQLVDLLRNQTQQQSQNLQSPQLEITCSQYEDIHTDNYLKNFDIIKCVGSGGFSKVYLVRAFGKLMAMKVINKEYIISNDKVNIINNEKTILSICSDHPFITKLQTSFETKNFLIFVMEFCNGGELFNLLRKVRRMKEEEAKFYFVQTLSAIVHLHRKGIVYRDIKPQNIIIDHEGHIRLADYGLSKIMQDTREAKTYSFCGSAQYMAPQMLLKKGHSFQIDFYCLGALLYQLVIGLPPYYSRNQNQLFSNIIHNELEFPAHVQLSDMLKNFLERLLQKQVQNRYKTFEEILSDPWMRNIRMEDVLGKKLRPPFKTDMFGYNFDDSDFAEEQKQITQKLKDEQSYHSFDDAKFPDFFFESKEIIDLKIVISKFKQQGLFIRSVNRNVGEFMAQTYNSRQISTNGSVVLNKQSRQPSINRMEHSTYLGIQSPSQINRRMQLTQGYHDKTPLNQVIYYPTSTPKAPLHSVRSLQHLGTTKSSMCMNRSQERISSLSKKAQNTYSNIYTTQKQPFHPFGMKVSTPSPLISSAQQSKSVTYIRQPNYYSVQKSSSRGDGIRLDIQDLKIKNQRNYSMERLRQPSSNLSQSFIPQHSNGSYMKHAVSAYELKRSYLDGLKDKNLGGKVKKSSLKNGEKISISMLNNVHYRN